MLDSLYKFSNLQIFFVLVALTLVISIISIFINKHLILHKLRYQDNPTIASISSLIGIMYGVLVGFIALYLLDNNDHASRAAQLEANALANVYRDSQWLQNPLRSEIDKELRAYAERVIQVEWPLMRQGKALDNGGDNLIHRVSADLKSFIPSNNSQMAILTDLLTQLNTLYNARHERIGMSAAQLSPELWEVILVGTILIIAINYAFRANFYLHLFGISAFAIMAASMLFLLVTLDRPFQGEFTVEPEALSSVLAFIEQNERGAST